MTQNVSRRKFLHTLGLTAAGAAIAACQPSTVVVEKVVEQAVEVERVVTATPSPTPPRKIGLQEPWRNNAENAPFHVAIHAGYFRDEGLEVTLVEGGPGVPGAINVLSGAHDIEIGCGADIGGFIPKVSAGVPYVVTGAILQKHPFGFFAITTNPKLPQLLERDPVPDDVRGTVIGTMAEQYTRSLLRKNGIPEDEVTIVKIAGESAADLLLGVCDWGTYWSINQPFGVTQEGLEYKALMFSDWAVPLYADVIYTTRERLRKDPELMRAVLRAVKRGMQRMIDEPAFAVEASSIYGGRGAHYDTPEKLEWRINVQNGMMQNEDTEKHGLLWMDYDKIREGIEFYGETGEIVPPWPEPQDFVTLDYLPAP